MGRPIIPKEQRIAQRAMPDPAESGSNLPASTLTARGHHAGATQPCQCPPPKSSIRAERPFMTNSASSVVGSRTHNRCPTRRHGRGAQARNNHRPGRAAPCEKASDQKMARGQVARIRDTTDPMVRALSDFGGGWCRRGAACVTPAASRVEWRATPEGSYRLDNVAIKTWGLTDSAIGRSALSPAALLRDDFARGLTFPDGRDAPEAEIKKLRRIPPVARR